MREQNESKHHVQIKSSRQNKMANAMSGKFGGPGAGFSGKEINHHEMPDYSNAQTRVTEERIGPFIYD